MKRESAVIRDVKVVAVSVTRMSRLSGWICVELVVVVQNDKQYCAGVDVCRELVICNSTKALFILSSFNDSELMLLNTNKNAFTD